MQEELEQLRVIFAADFDCNQAYEDDNDFNPERLLRSLVIVRPLTEEDGEWYPCGGASLEDTPRALYRALYLFRPKDVDFTSMYKTNLFEFLSKDERFCVSVELFKYKLGLYFYCRKEDLLGKGSCVTAGHPGANNRRSCGDQTGRVFFEIVRQALTRAWSVYDGNEV